MDRHFAEGVHRDPVKLRFLESIQRIAEQAQCRVIAEGIGTEPELLTVREIGIAPGQGYVLARPTASPATSLPPAVHELLQRPGVAVLHHCGSPPLKRVTADRSLPAIPVVENDVPLGLINRFRFPKPASQKFFPDLHGRKPCRAFMHREPLIVDRSMSIQDLPRLLVAGGQRHLWEGFIITEGGRYAGIGTGHDLMHWITELQINAARYANPLTLLPGNVPISEHMNRLLRAGVPFTVAYADLNAFKAFNDRYGYRRGDDVIQTLARALIQHTDPDRDFVGHIGGDDFIVLFQSGDWEARARRIVEDFASAVTPFFSAEDRAAGGYLMEDRQGRPVFHPLVSVAIGCVEIPPGVFSSEHEVADVAAEAKKQAKLTAGGVFVNRRRYGPRID